MKLTMILANSLGCEIDRITCDSQAEVEAALLEFADTLSGGDTIRVVDNDEADADIQSGPPVDMSAAISAEIPLP